jgi:hypothetical protein
MVIRIEPGEQDDVQQDPRPAVANPVAPVAPAPIGPAPVAQEPPQIQGRDQQEGQSFIALRGGETLDQLLEQHSASVRQQEGRAFIPLRQGETLQQLLDQHSATVRQQREDLALASFALAVKSDPNTRAEAQKIAQELGIDPDTVERNRDVMRRHSQVKAARLADLADRNPALARHVADLEWARIAHDDLPVLSKWERLVSSWNAGELEVEQGRLGERLRSGRATKAELDRLAWVRARLHAIPRPEGFLEGSAKILGQQSQIIPEAAKRGMEFAVAGAATALVAGQAGPQLATPEEVLTVPGAAALGFGVGFTGELAMQSFFVEGGNAFVEMIESGYDRDAASRAAFGVGVANMALEMVGVKLLAKGAGITREALRETFGAEVRQAVATTLARPTRAEAFKVAARGVGTGLLGEVTTEVLQEGVNITAEEIARRLSVNADELQSTVTRGEIVQRLVETAVQTFQGMALLSLPGPGLRFMRDARRAAAAEHTAQWWRDLGQTADASKLRERSPGAAERFLATAAKGTQAENAYIDGQALSQVLQQEDVERSEKGEATLSEKLEAAVPGLVQRVQEAAERGEDVVIPTATVAAHIAGTEAYGPLLPHLRLDPDAMSAAEAQVFRKEAAERAAEAERLLQQDETEGQAFRASARQVEEGLRDQLLQTLDKNRITRDEAVTAAKFYRDIVVLKAKQKGILPQQFVEMFPLQVLSARDRQGFQQMDEAAPAPTAEQQAMDGAAPAEPGAARAPATDVPQGQAPPAGEQPLQSGGRGSYDPKRLQILLHEKADVSTFMHELAHHYLHVLGELAAAPDAPDVIRQDMDRLLRWFGVADLETWRSMDLEQQRRHHEAFAYGFEIWLWEGQAPAPEFKGIFEGLARFLRKAYVTIRDELNPIYRKNFGTDLPVLTREVRQVMEGMVASEAQIQHQADVRNMAGVFESQEAAGVSDQEWQDYLDSRREANQATLEAHQRDSLRQLRWLSGARAKILRELQGKEQKAREHIQAQVEDELRRDPVYRALRWLTHGEFDGEKSAVPGRHKLSTEAVRALLPEGTDMRRLAGRYGIVHKDGVLPDAVAPAFGFAAGRDLVQAVVNAKPFDQVVKERVDARMLEEHSDLADPRRREMAADRALHDEARTRQIAVEMRMLSRSMQPVRVMTAAAKEAAKRIIGRQKAGSIDPRRHAAAEAQAAKRVREALRKGRTAEAIEAQRQRLLQHEMFKAALEAEDDVQAALEGFNRFQQPDAKIAEHRVIDIAYAGRALAAAFGFGPKLMPGQEADLVAAALTGMAATHPVLATHVNSWLSLQGVRGGAWVDLTVEEIRDLKDLGDNLWSEAGREKTIEVQGRRTEVAGVAAALAGRLESLPRRQRPSGGKTPTGLQRQVLSLWGYVASLKRMVHWARLMDGGNDGPFHRYFLDPIDKALAIYRNRRDAMIAVMRERIVAVANAAGAGWDADISCAELGGTVTVLRGKKELLGALLHAGSLSNLTKLLVGNGWAQPPHETNDILITDNWDRFLRRMFREGVLTQQDVEFVRFVWDTYAQQLPENQAAHKKLYGYEFRTIQHRNVETPWGTLDGGYVPAYADRDRAQPLLGKKLDSLEGEEHSFIFSVSTGRGHTLARNEFYMPPLSLDVSRQIAHMDQQMRFIYLQPALKDVARIVRHRDFKDALDAYDRDAAESIILPWLDSVAAHSATRPGNNRFVDALATFVRRSVSMVYLGFNLGNSLIQLSGLNNARQQVEGRWLRAGLRVFAGGPMAAVRDAMDRSSMMRDRFDTTAERLREEISTLGVMKWGVNEPIERAVLRFRQKLGRAAFWAQRIVQGTVDTVTWHGAYQQSMANSKTDGSLTLEQAEAIAVRDADLAVRRSQGSGNPEDVAAFEATTPLMKLMLQFMSYPNLVLNQIMTAGHGISPRVRALLWTLLVPAITESTLKMLLTGMPDDDDGDGLEDELALHYAKGVARNAAGLVPVIGPMALAMAESEGQRVMQSPAGSLMQSVFQAFYETERLIQDGEPTARGLRALGTALTVATGFPIVPLTRAAAYEIDVEQGRRPEPVNVVDRLRGLIVGR